MPSYFFFAGASLVGAEADCEEKSRPGSMGMPNSDLTARETSSTVSTTFLSCKDQNKIGGGEAEG